MAQHAATNNPIDCPSAEEMESLWDTHTKVWRDSAQVISHWQDAESVQPKLLEYTVTGDWWSVLDSLQITLLIGREYEHLLLAATVAERETVDGIAGGITETSGCGSSVSVVSYMPLPHPSGIATDKETGSVFIASTRNPNQIFEMSPISGAVARLDSAPSEIAGSPLVPVTARFLPGCLYIHDLALVNGSLYANAVGQNAIIRLDGKNSFEPVWWPKCVENEHGPVFGQNYIQLNSIAATDDIQKGFFSASSEQMAELRPGHPDYPVDGRGVIFSGETREVIARGLTRPHSARLETSTGSPRLFVDNSGYGEFGLIEDEKLQPLVKLPGWTRGLAICGNTAFVGTSRVIPKFAQYAPGLDVNASICGVHAVDIRSGKVLGSMIWPYGNQIFAIDWLPRRLTTGFPHLMAEPSRDLKTLYYTYSTSSKNSQDSQKAR